MCVRVCVCSRFLFLYELKHGDLQNISLLCVSVETLTDGGFLRYF